MPRKGWTDRVMGRRFEGEQDSRTAAMSLRLVEVWVEGVGFGRRVEEQREG